MNTLIVYGSHHHGSTKRLAVAIAQAPNVRLWDAESQGIPPLADYDRIGFASGIDFGKFYPAVTAIAEALPAGKQVFALFTCARDNGKYGDEIRELAARQGCLWLGKFGCRGYNTYGPWKLIGGMNKSCPTPEELSQAQAFYRNICTRADRA